MVKTWPEKGVVLAQVQLFWTSTSYGLEILHQCGKRVKTKSHKDLEPNFNLCRSCRWKTGRTGEELFAPLILNRINYFYRSRSIRAEVLCKKDVLQKFPKIHLKSPMLEPLFLSSLLKNFIKKLWHKCFL